VSASGTLRTQGFVVNQAGIQAAPERRGSHATPGLSSPGNPTGGVLAPVTPDLGSASGSGASGSSTPLHPSDFIELGSVGKGACGVVRRALHAPSLRVIALKEISVWDQAKRRQFVKELTALGSVNSPYICGFAGAFFAAEGRTITILLEYANRHSLAEVLQAHGPLHETLLQRVALHTFRGLQILREQHVIHRDIKPGNLLIHSGAASAGGVQVKLTDFGVVTALEGTMDLASTFVGTTIFMAPERVSAEGTYSYASDVWSAAMSLYNLATGELPYAAATGFGYFGIVKAIRDDPVPSLPELSPATNEPFSKELRSFLAACLVKDPAARPSAAQMLAHPWLAGADAAWDAAVAAAEQRGTDVHPLCKLSAADVSDLDAILSELIRTSYNNAKPSAGTDPRKSLMHQARIARLTLSLNNPKLSAQIITQRFDKLFEAARAAHA